MHRLASLRNAPEQILQLNNEVSDISWLLTIASAAIDSSSLSCKDRARLYRLLERVEDPLLRLRNLLREYNFAVGIVQDLDPSGDEHVFENVPVQKPEFSKRAWLKKGETAKRLLTSLRLVRSNISDVLLAASTSENLHVRAEVRSIAAINSRLEKALRHHRQSNEALATLNATISSFIPSITNLTKLGDGVNDVGYDDARERSNSMPSPDQGPRAIFEIKTAVRPDNRCPLACGCQCHRVSRFQDLNWTRKLIGSLFVGYSGVPLLTARACTERSCRGHRKSVIKVSYFFPGWLVSRMVFFMNAWDCLQGSDSLIRIPKVITSDSELFLLAQKGSIEGMQRLFARSLGSIYDINDSEGRSALHFAISARQAQMCSFLLSQGANARVEDKFSISPIDLLWNHLLRNDVKGTNDELRVAFGALLDDSEDLVKRRFSPIHRIVFGLSNIDVDKYLQLTTAEIDVACSLGRTPLFWASVRNDPSIVRTLLQYGASIKISDGRKQTPLHVVSAYGVIDSLRLLLNSVTVPWGNFPVNRRAETNLRLREAIDALDIKGRTPLDGAAHADRAEHAQLLIEYGADVDPRDSVLGRTPLMLCIYWNHHGVMKVLLSNSARTDVVDRRNMSVLHYAAKFGDSATLCILLRSNNFRADPALIDDDGRTAMDLFTSSRKECVQESAIQAEESRTIFTALVQAVRPRYSDSQQED